MAMIRTVADRIIPQTDTPGALAAKVPEYIAAVFNSHFDDEQKTAFVDGLDALADAGLASAETKAQDAILTQFANSPDDSVELGIFQQLHDMTLFGFYTSEEATRELSYEELPGRYDGCVPLAEIGRAWLERGV